MLYSGSFLFLLRSYSAISWPLAGGVRRRPFSQPQGIHRGIAQTDRRTPGGGQRDGPRHHGSVADTTPGLEITHEILLRAMPTPRDRGAQRAHRRRSRSRRLAVSDGRPACCRQAVGADHRHHDRRGDRHLALAPGGGDWHRPGFWPAGYQPECLLAAGGQRDRVGFSGQHLDVGGLRRAAPLPGSGESDPADDGRGAGRHAGLSNGGDHGSGRPAQQDHNRRTCQGLLPGPLLLSPV